ncbi:hypothetical protein [Chitinophaga polysaccharea]|uniref:hypothetical protein n=1 Tax=Chitinophaga polysaccharea TaxID=1293035 RepID=UPI0011574B48|nr:hypothetical protein [Chitinophaga polysaccharea]
MKSKIQKGIGRLVVVHPELTVDPANMKGEIGRVLAFNNSADISVQFPNGTVGRYQPDALLTLKSPVDILATLKRSLEQLCLHQQKSVLEIARLVLNGEPIKALESTGGRELFLYYCTMSFQQWIEAKQKSSNSLKL